MKCGVPRHTATRLLSNQLKSISFRYLETICLRLNCTIDDLFTYTPDKNLLNHNQHALNKLKRLKTKDSVSSKLKDLTLDKLDQVRDFINELEKSKTNPSQ